MARYFNSNVKYIRKIKNISQETLSEGTGIDRSLLSRIENNLIETSVEYADKIASFLNIPISDMVSKDLSNDLEQNYSTIEEVKETINRLPNSEINEDGKKSLINMVDTLNNLNKKQ